MAALSTVNTNNRAGNVLAMAAAAGGGDTFVNTGREHLIITNGSGAPITVTFVVPKTIDGLTVSNKTMSVAAGATRVVGPFPVDTYSDANGNVSLTYSGVTTLTIGVIQPA
jgi:hypothetical protein